MAEKAKVIGADDYEGNLIMYEEPLKCMHSC